MNMILKFSVLLLGLVLINSAAQAQTGPITITNANIETARIEIFYDAKSDSGQLHAYSEECKECSPTVLPINKTAQVEQAGVAVPFAELLLWKNAIVDLSYDKQSLQVVSVRRQ